MSVIEIDGVSWAAGLDWLPRGNAVQTVYEARRGNAEWYVHYGDQTGYGKESDRHKSGMPALAAALHQAIPEQRWMAVLLGDFGGCALIQVNDGVILSDGDMVFEKYEQVRPVLDEIDRTGWTFYASSGVIEGGKPLDVKSLSTDAGLKGVPLSGVTKRSLTGAGAGLVAVGLLIAGWTMRSHVMDLIYPPPELVKTPEKEKEPRIAAVIDSGALIEGCREAMRRYTPGMPGWKVSALECTARFADSGLTDATGSEGLGLVDFVAMLALYVMVAYGLVNAAFKLIDVLPNAVLAWIGGQGTGETGSEGVTAMAVGGFGRAGGFRGPARFGATRRGEALRARSGVGAPGGD